MSLINLLNCVKKTQIYPTIFRPANISSFWKRKGDKSDLDNDRGVFNVTKIQSIMDKMIYNDIYEPFDAQMSCSNIGARKNRNFRDHISTVKTLISRFTTWPSSLCLGWLDKKERRF